MQHKMQQTNYTNLTQSNSMIDPTITIALISSATSIILAFLGFYFAKILKQRKTNSNKITVEDRIRRDNVILQVLNDIRDRFSFSNCYISMFHNGTSYYTGDAMQKVSMVFEVTDPTTPSIASSLQGIPSGIYTRILNELITNPVFSILDIESEPDPHTKNMLKGYHIKQIYHFKLCDEVGFCGVLVCYFANKKKPLDEVDIEYIKTQVAKISSLLKLTNKFYKWQKEGKVA